MAEDLGLDLAVFNNVIIVQKWHYKGITEIIDTMRKNTACFFRELNFKKIPEE